MYISGSVAELLKLRFQLRATKIAVTVVENSPNFTYINCVSISIVKLLLLSTYCVVLDTLFTDCFCYHGK